MTRPPNPVPGAPAGALGPTRWRTIAMLGIAGAALAIAGARPAERVPAIVFVSRLPLAEPGAIPGFGPHHRAAAPGGRLLLRTPTGVVRDLLAPGAFHDVSDPAISPDAGRVAFAAVVRPGARWRLWSLELATGRTAAITGGESGDFDDLDPRWVTARLLCFSSTRLPARSQYGDVPVTNLWLVGDGGEAPRRITTERNGADEPRVDPRTGEIVYSRWWFNPWRPDGSVPLGVRRGSAGEAGVAARDADAAGGAARGAAAASGAAGETGATVGPAPEDSVNLWQLVAIAPDRLGPRLAAGAALPRRDASAYEASLDPSGGRVIAAYASNLGLSPAHGPTGVHELSRTGGSTRPLLGAIVPASGADPYRNATGLSAASACAPAVLDRGRTLVSWDPGARGDWGIYLVRRDAPPEPIADLPGTLELDAAPVTPWSPARTAAWERVRGASADADRALRTGAIEDPALGTFVFDCTDVFAGPGAPPRTPGTRLVVYAASPMADTVVRIRDLEVGPAGRVRAELPAGVPLFETLVDREGATLRAAHGPTHVAGSNAGARGQVTRCAGCHLGHSRLDPTPRGRR